MVETRSQKSIRENPLPGGAKDLVPIAGIEGLITTVEGYTQASKDAVEDMKIILDRSVTMVGQAQSELVTSIKDEMARGPLISPGVRLSDAPMATPTDPIHDGVPAAPPRSPEQDPFITQVNREREALGYQMPGGLPSLGSIRQETGRLMQRRLENRQPRGDQYTLDDAGLWHGPDGQFVSDDDPGLSNYMRRQTVTMAGRGFAQTLAEGGTIRAAGGAALGGSALGMGALKAAGVAGLAFTAVNAAGSFVENQRAQNAQWQRIMGGTNIGGFGERIGQRLFGISQFGGLGGEDAERLYAAVAATGLRGDDRQGAQQFAVEAYKNFGMTIDQSMEIINTASETGQESLLGVSLALDKVTESAVEAEVNTERARQSFVDSWQSLTDIVGGSAALVTAMATSQAITNLGREFQDVSVAPGLSQIDIIAARKGISPAAYLAQTRLDPQLLNLDQQTLVTQELTNYVPQSLLDNLAPYKAKVDRGEELTEADLVDIDQFVLNAPGMDIRSYQAILQSFGGFQGLTELTTSGVAGAILTGTYDPQTEAEEVIQESRAVKYLGGGTQADYLQRSRRTPEDKRFADVIDVEMKELLRRVDASDTGMFDFGDEDIRGAFKADVRETGRIGGFSQMIAENANLRGTLARVMVTDNDGKRVEVDLVTAMNQYRDQLDEGTATIVGGSFGGETVGSFFQREMGVLSGVEGQLTGNITITPSPELQRLLEFQVSGDAFSGLYPGEPHVTPDARPTGVGH